MDFGKALDAMKAGKKVRRKKWDSNNYIAYDNVSDKNEYPFGDFICRTNFKNGTHSTTSFKMCPEHLVADDWEIIEEKLDFNAAFEALNNGEKIWRPGMSEDSFLFRNGNVILKGITGKGIQSYGIQYNDIISKDWIVKEATDNDIYKNVVIIYECPECHRRYTFSSSFEQMKKNKTTLSGCVCGKPFSIVHLENPFDVPFYKRLISDYQKWLETSISYWENQIQMDDIPTRNKCEELNKLINEQNLMIENGLYFILSY